MTTFSISVEKKRSKARVTLADLGGFFARSLPDSAWFREFASGYVVVWRGRPFIVTLSGGPSATTLMPCGAPAYLAPSTLKALGEWLVAQGVPMKGAAS